MVDVTLRVLSVLQRCLSQPIDRRTSVEAVDTHGIREGRTEASDVLRVTVRKLPTLRLCFCGYCYYSQVPLWYPLR